jgi:predicted metalloprotease with PDZ domain
VRYILSPVMSAGSLTAVAVEMRFRGGTSGRTILDLPGRFGGVADHWRYVTKLRVDGATTIANSPAERELRHSPGAPLIVRYEVRTAYDADPDGDEGNPYKGAVIRPSWFAALGNFTFAKPAGMDSAPAALVWKGWPRAWVHISDADASPSRPQSVEDVIQSTLLAGREVALRTRPITGGTLRLATLGRWTWDLDRYADMMGRIVSAERGFWGDISGPYTVTLFELAPGKSFSSSGGTGRAHGFTQYASADIGENDLIANISHEHLHGWIPGRLGEAPEGPAGAGLYWFSEGFTDFYAARLLLRSGVWTPQKFIETLNGKLADYASSSARDFPNVRIVTDFWTDPAVEKLPYRRGELFAYRLDRELRGEGHDRGLDDLMFAMRDRWRAAPAGAKPALAANFDQATASLGLDVREDLARFIEAGEPLGLAPDQFAGCATVATISIAAFDPGFDRDASLKAGVFAGLDPRGPAYAAGLRDGMKRVARLSGHEGDSRVLLQYRVLSDGVERVIGWKPEGKGRLTLQEVRLDPGLSARQLAACAHTM